MAGHAQDHDFFIPNNSIWPPLTCLGAGFVAFGFVIAQHAMAGVGQLMMWLGLAVILFGAIQWFRLLIAESRARGFDNVAPVLDLQNRYGMIFFIISEIMFFSAFFAAFFYLKSWNPEWPPANIESFGIDLPIINTLLLLSSGATVTWAHHAILEKHYKEARLATFITWHLGVIFLALQAFEYYEAIHHMDLTLSSGVYGSTFFMLTGFHGFHVLLGTLMLMVAHFRMHKGDFTDKHHFYFEATAWYWHFVDVVWVGLFLFVYLL